MSPSRRPCDEYLIVFENQPIASGILTQLSHYKRAESNLPADKKGSRQKDPGSCLVIYLYYKFIHFTLGCNLHCIYNCCASLFGSYFSKHIYHQNRISFMNYLFIPILIYFE